MNDALQLLVADYLSLMRESGELDAFMPLLIAGMGHQVLHTAQRGVREQGVDMASVGKDDKGRKTLFMWVLKCGNIGRIEWNVGSQSIQHSLDDLVQVYVRANIPPEHKKLPRKAMVVTNGEFLSSVQQNMTGLFESLKERYDLDVSAVNNSVLAAWTVDHLFDEHILPVERRMLFRRMLANVSQPDLCISIGRQLIDGLVADLPVTEGSKGSQKKRTLLALRGVRAVLSALTLRGAAEENVLAPYRLSEYAVLAVWSRLHAELAGAVLPANAKEFARLVRETMTIALRYHERLDGYYRTQDAFAYVLPHNLFLSQRIFEEAGRLGFQGCFWAWQSRASDKSLGLHWAYANKLVCLLQTHSGLQFPAFDHQATDIHHGLLLLSITGYMDEAKNWVNALCQRFSVARAKKELWPTVQTLEQQLQVRFDFEEPTDNGVSSSTLIPILLLWTAALGLDEGYKFLREVLIPETKWSTPNLWSPDAGYDGILDDHRELASHGVGEALAFVPAEPTEYLARMAKVLPGVEPIAKADWYKSNHPFIPMLAALHWGLQLPREMLVQQAVAFCEGGQALALRLQASGSASKGAGHMQ
ncbi:MULTISPECIES: hypothetical protein [unclassified Roseateles]|uniref:hypothetical protein n=1 Tax=unclassified Roseateles TaxID=2626991 RepID=UPI0006F443D6|nr:MULTISPECIES: hypothetical protein [unclassified Roseateles]KQW51202.1 hypothetical protein ASC81_00670 [Pelomonas sp. Root405]KRA77434.1 hypothetical protein ASD88_00670 [Pelomonas sp. Root662]